MHGLSPCAIHLIVLLGVLLLCWTTCTSCHLLLLLLHHLHALHLLSGRRCVLLLHPSLLFTVLLGLQLLPLRSGHLLLLLVLLTAVLVVVLLLSSGGVVGGAGGPGRIGSHIVLVCSKSFLFKELIIL